ncbi:MAG: poly-beta-hydroxybutyrate polymerase [Rhodospirillales bacterium 69-11]|nr:MAG: poly-beta-hydroxybutyrate polymerase [Rhodospirillales bacterium 69-11]
MTPRPDAPGPNQRRGPRPLLLHLTLAMLRSSVSRGTSPNWNRAWQDSSAAIIDGLRASLASGDAEAAFSRTVVNETLRQDAALIAGIAAYRRHPWHRTLADPPTLWEEGGSRLLDYGAGERSAEAGPTVLFVPSLINRAYVLDLAPDHSMLRWLARQGIRPLLLDWGWPGAAERQFTLTDYVAGRLERALGAAVGLSGGPVVLAGYCMGGTLAVAAAERRPDLVQALALLATPWDFHAEDEDRARQAAACLPLLEPALAVAGTLPIDVLQMLFALLDPWSVARKYRAFSRLDPNGGAATLFVALEDWLNDGVPLAAPVARTCLRAWYGENAPARGAWQIAGLPVDPGRLRLPCLVAAPARDRIVPPGSAKALAALIPHARLHVPAAGHVGMVAGSRAEPELWRPLLAWLRDGA